MRTIKDLRIIYLGTPEFAVAPLKYMVEAGLNIVAVVTAPDKPAGRGMQMQMSEVKTYALSAGLKILQPEKLKEDTFVASLKALQADIQIVVAFRMLPEVVWNMPAMGTLNLHASLLPQYRGAAPINWAIINGETVTGITTFLLKHEIDTGNILLQEQIAINPLENVGMLYQTMMHKGGALLIKTLEGLVQNTITPVEQAMLPNAKHAPKIFKQTCEIDFTKNAKQVNDFIRGLSPYPCAFTKIIDNKTIKIFEALFNNEALEFENGLYLTDNKTFLYLKCAQGYISVLNLQMEGKKRLDIKAFLQGYKFN